MELVEILKILGIGLFVVILSVIFKELKQEYSVMLMIAGGILITLWGLAKIYPVLDYIRQLTDASNISEYFSIILKVLGVSFLVQTGASVCRDLGEASIASKIEFAGKAVILVMILPILKSVIAMGLELLS